MKIVIVEDDDQARQDIADMIAGMNPGYEVSGIASDGYKGMDMILKEHPDVVLTALGLPGMDGLTMLA